MPRTALSVTYDFNCYELATLRVKSKGRGDKVVTVTGNDGVEREFVRFTRVPGSSTPCWRDAGMLYAYNPIQMIDRACGILDEGRDAMFVQIVNVSRYDDQAKKWMLSLARSI